MPSTISGLFSDRLISTAILMSDTRFVGVIPALLVIGGALPALRLPAVELSHAPAEAV